MLGDCTEEVKVELDKLNLASSSINQLENQLEECRRQFQLALSEGSKQLSATYRKLKSSIEKSRPYSEVFYRRQQLILDIQRNSEQYGVAQAEFEAAQSVLDNYSSAAKFQHTDLSQLDDVNRAIDKVNLWKKKSRDLQAEHEQMLSQCRAYEEELSLLRSQLGSSIKKAKPYFEMKFEFSQRMEEAKSYVDSLSERLKENKALYSQTLRQLEAISDRIHASRRSLGLEGEHCVNGLQGTFLSACLRGSGVGAEAKSDPLSEALRQRLSPFSSPLPPPCSSPNRQKRLLSSISSIPDSPRRTPPGQLDTDPEEEGSLTAGQTTFSDFLPILNGLREALNSCKLASDESGQWSNLQALAHWRAVTIPTSFDVNRQSVGPRDHSFATPQLPALRQIRRPSAQSHKRSSSC
uniref:SH3 domain-binding protein 5-like n=1 Tax=Schistocephalus solidus TaxID=70667 RepID=A0A0X3P6C5_SCHSO